jgi:ArsR family transcriptional regulator
MNGNKGQVLQRKICCLQIVFRHLSKYLILLNTLFKALNDPTRRAILELLKDKDLTAGEIADQFNISKPSISHHLDLLKQADLVNAEKQGQFIYYTINTTVMDEMIKWLMQLSPKKKKQ